METIIKESLEVGSFPDLRSRNQSITSLEGFRSPSPLPASQGLLSGNQNIAQKLAKTVQTDGIKVAKKLKAMQILLRGLGYVARLAN